MHMMSIGTGIPGNPPWPENSKFDSTVDFDILVPDYKSTAAMGTKKWNCHGVMKNGTVMEGLVSCGKGGSAEDDEQGGVAFGMQAYTGLGDRRPELSFWLWVYRLRWVSSPLLLFRLSSISIVMYVIEDTDASHTTDNTRTLIQPFSKAQRPSQRTMRKNRVVTSPVFKDGHMMG